MADAEMVAKAMRRAAERGVDISWLCKPLPPVDEAVLRDVRARNEAAYGTPEKRANLLGSMANLGAFARALAPIQAELQAVNADGTDGTDAADSVTSGPARADE